MINNSGFDPLDLRVLIKLDEIEEFSEGGILLANKTQKDEQMAQVTGTIIAKGENAFSELSLKPDVGDRVVIGKYVGWLTTGDDEKDYRIVNDEDVIARKI